MEGVKVHLGKIARSMALGTTRETEEIQEARDASIRADERAKAAERVVAFQAKQCYPPFISNPDRSECRTCSLCERLRFAITQRQQEESTVQDFLNQEFKHDPGAWFWVQKIRARRKAHGNSWQWSNKEAAKRLDHYFKELLAVKPQGQQEGEHK